MAGDKQPLERLSTFVEPELAAAFKRIARDNERKISAELRRLVRAAIEAAAPKKWLVNWESGVATPCPETDGCQTEQEAMEAAQKAAIAHEQATGERDYPLGVWPLDREGR